MPTSPRLNWPYPKQFSDPYWDSFVSFVNAVDASFFTTREDKNFVLFGGGLVSFNATSGDLTWAEPLQAVAATTGYRWYVPNSTSGDTVTLEDGEFLYVELTRAPQSTQSIAAETGSRIPVSDNAIVLAQRLDDAVIWRNGSVIGDGQSIYIFGPRVLTQVYEVVGIAGAEITDSVTWEGHGGFKFDPRIYYPGGLGLTREVRFQAMLETTDGTTPLPAKARLYDLTNGAAVTSSEITSSSETPEIVSSGVLSIGTGGGVDLQDDEIDYEVQIILDDSSGSPGPTDVITCKRASLRLTWV